MLTPNFDFFVVTKLTDSKNIIQMVYLVHIGKTLHANFPGILDRVIFYVCCIIG